MIFTPEERRAVLTLAALLLLGQGLALWEEHRRSLPDRELSRWLQTLTDEQGDSIRAAAEPMGANLLGGLRVTGAGAALDSVPIARVPTVSRRPPAPVLPLDSLPPGILETGRLRINAAGAEELESLPGVGPALARRILEERERGGPFRQPSDLLRVKGIGPKKLKALGGKIDWALSGGDPRSGARNP